MLTKGQLARLFRTRLYRNFGYFEHVGQSYMEQSHAYIEVSTQVAPRAVSSYSVSNCSDCSGWPADV